MSQQSRINGFDAMRTVAMWLGVVLHAIIAYKFTAESGWPHDPAADSVVLDWIYNLIHAFRMPLFFLVAGFFSRMVLLKSGLVYFIRQRFKRIVIPFVIGVIVLVPVTLLPFHFNKYFYLRGMPIDEAKAAAMAEITNWNGLAHLWFLYYLILFYGIATGCYWLMSRKNWFFSDRYKQHFSKIRPGIIVLITMVLGIILYSNKAYIPEVYTGIWPNLFYTAYYGLFFASGWLLQVNPQSVHSLGSYSWLYFLAGVGLSFLFSGHQQAEAGSPALYFLAAAYTILLVAGTMGLFMKYFHRENRVWRYLSDSAYWVYLVHMGVVAFMQVLLLEQPWNPLLKLVVVLLAAFIFSLLTYHFFVRFTIIGEYLHGKRFREVSGKAGEKTGMAVR